MLTTGWIHQGPLLGPNAIQYFLHHPLGMVIMPPASLSELVPLAYAFAPMPSARGVGIKPNWTLPPPQVVEVGRIPRSLRELYEAQAGRSRIPRGDFSGK